MKKLIFILPILLISCSTKSEIPADTTKSVYGEMLSQKELLEDMDFLFDTLLENHPNPYYFTDEETINAMREDAVREIKANAPMDFLDLWEILSPIVLELHDGHTGLYFYSDNDYDQSLRIYSTAKFTLCDQGLYLKYAPYESTNTFNKKIVSMNGVPVHEILSNFTTYWHNGTLGYTEDFLERKTIDTIYYSSYHKAFYTLYGFQNEIELGLEDGTFATLPLFSKAADSFHDYFTSEIAYPEFFSIEDRGYSSFYFDIISNDVGYLDVETFYQDFVQNTDTNYFTFLKSVFTTLKTEQPPYLIVDITGNGGGSDFWWATLFCYLYGEPFKINANYAEAVSLEDFLSRLTNEDLDQHTPDGYEPDWEALHYDGKVYLLIDEFVFSAAENFAIVSKYYDAATLVGCEGGKSGTAFGNVNSFRLPNSNLKFNCTTSQFTTVDGNAGDAAVQPDVYVNTFDYDNIEDYWSQDRDNVYKKVFELIEADRNGE